MDKELIIEKNKLIAEYMGYKYFPYIENNNSNNKDFGWKKHKNVTNSSKLNVNRRDYLCRNHNQLCYNSDWNYLMEVIEELYNRNNIITSISNILISTSLNDEYLFVEYYKSNLILKVFEIIYNTIKYLVDNNIDLKIPVFEYKEKYKISEEQLNNLFL